MSIAFKSSKIFCPQACLILIGLNQEEDPYMPTLVGSDFFLSTKQHIFAIVIIITSINYLDYSFQFFAMTYK